MARGPGQAARSPQPLEAVTSFPGIKGLARSRAPGAFDADPTHRQAHSWCLQPARSLNRGSCPAALSGTSVAKTRTPSGTVHHGAQRWLMGARALAMARITCTLPTRQPTSPSLPEVNRCAGWVSGGGNLVPEPPLATWSWDWMTKMGSDRSAPLLSDPLESAPMTSAVLKVSSGEVCPYRGCPLRLAPPAGAVPLPHWVCSQ